MLELPILQLYIHIFMFIANIAKKYIGSNERVDPKQQFVVGVFMKLQQQFSSDQSVIR